MYYYVVKWPVFSLQRGWAKWPIAPSNFSSLCFSSQQDLVNTNDFGMPQKNTYSRICLARSNIVRRANINSYIVPLSYNCILLELIKIQLQKLVRYLLYTTITFLLVSRSKYVFRVSSQVHMYLISDIYYLIPDWYQRLTR